MTVARVALAVAAMLALTGCSGMAQVCEDIEPWRPLIRGAIDVATEGATVVPFMVTSRISCADLEEVAERLRDQR